MTEKNSREWHAVIMKRKQPKIQTDQIKEYLKNHKAVKFAYLFGSHAAGKAGPLSDLDIGVYLDGRVNSLTHRLKLLEELVRITNNEKIEVVVLNAATPMLKYEVIRYNHILKDDAPRRVIFETEVLRDYLDTAYLRRIHQESIIEKIKSGEYFG
jgi:predicted nucleotidyltransferase